MVFAFKTKYHQWLLVLFEEHLTKAVFAYYSFRSNNGNSLIRWTKDLIRKWNHAIRHIIHRNSYWVLTIGKLSWKHQWKSLIKSTQFFLIRKPYKKPTAHSKTFIHFPWRVNDPGSKQTFWKLQRPFSWGNFIKAFFIWKCKQSIHNQYKIKKSEFLGNSE